MVSNGKWVLPLGGNLLRAGATYQWKTLDSLASAEAEQTLRAAAIELLGTDTHLTLHEHVAGVRAGTRDKHPFAGFHPGVTGIGIFGGFGSRGVLTIPHYADCFVQLVLDDNPLPDEIDIARYIDRYAAG
jgi:glycine/D-amino acid oxidase-like deaminating enzyme